MAVLVVFAFLSGILTILSPCILPLLPIILSGGLNGGKARPLGIVFGFVLSFSFFTLLLSVIVAITALSPDFLRIVAVAVIVFFGLTMILPSLQRGFERFAVKIGKRASRRPDGQAETRGWKGLGSGLLVGVSLGLVWTPCVGPIMASISSLALSQNLNGGAVAITIAYSLGTALPMLGIMLGGKALVNRVPWISRRSAGIQRLFGVLMVAIGVSIGFGWDRQFQSALLSAFPAYGAGLTSLENVAPVRAALDARAPARSGSPSVGLALGVASVFTGTSGTISSQDRIGEYGSVPEIAAKGSWFNTEGKALSMTALRGKVVLVDFWTYSCVNCIRTLPYLKAWVKTYGNQGFVVLGVHTPEFEFEKNPANVASAIRDLGVSWPVVQDNEYAQWNAYGNQYWPAHYLIDAKGTVRYFHFGEGANAETEAAIRQLLAEKGASLGSALSQADLTNEAQTPETYLGYDRARGFASDPAMLYDLPRRYAAQGTRRNGEWALDGSWTIAAEYARADSGSSLTLQFSARRVFLVIEPEEEGARLRVFLDGKPAPDTIDLKSGELVPMTSRLYTLVDVVSARSGELRLEATGHLRLYAFTFG